MTHNFSLRSGERQVATTWDEVREDHRARYEWADEVIAPGGFGLDCFAGVGYGAQRLAVKDRSVWAVDGSREGIAHAAQFFFSQRVMFSVRHWPFEIAEATADFVVSLESIEHVDDGTRFFQALAAALKPGGVMVFSVPCEEALPHAKMGNHFHHRHYTRAQAFEMANHAGLKINGWCGQDAYVMDEGRPVAELTAPGAMRLKAETLGQFLIIAASKPS